MATVRVGISGWRYAPWRGRFYPKDLPQKRELEYASRQVSTIEINGSFYSLQSPASYQAWHDQTPDDFVFAVKGGRFITHLRRLKEPQSALANFFASGVLLLRRKLGPFLWQLPPNFAYDAQRLAGFFRALPRTTGEAASLARRHDDRLKHPAVTRSTEELPLRHALEVRHTSFECRGFVEQLREHNVGMVVADTAGRWPRIEDVTSDFVYVRLHGDTELYASGYTDTALRTWARSIRSWLRGRSPAAARRLAPPPRAVAKGRDVYVYFDNDVKVHAPFDAARLAGLLKA